MAQIPERREPRFRPSSHVEVRSSLDGHWIDGFTVDAVEVDDSGQERVRIRRPDGSVLPAWFAEREIRTS